MGYFWGQCFLACVSDYYNNTSICIVQRGLNFICFLIHFIIETLPPGIYEVPETFNKFLYFSAVNTATTLVTPLRLTQI